MPKDVAAPLPDNAFSVVRNKLDMEAELVTTDDSSLKTWIEEKLAAILTAGTFEEINSLAAESGLTKSKDLIGRTLEIRDFALRESAEAYRENSSLQKFVIVQAVDVNTGEELIIDGGGDTFTAQLVAMRDRYDFPYTGTLLGMRTGAGYDMLYWRFSDPKRKPLF
jgi:hypothetical protein